MIIQGNTRYIGTEILNEVAKRKKKTICIKLVSSFLLFSLSNTYFQIAYLGWILNVLCFLKTKNIILKLKINCNMLVIVWFTLLQLSVQTLLQSLLRVFHLSLEIYEISLQKFFIALAWQFLRYALLWM